MARSAKALDAAIAVTRFGLGARPGEIDTVADDPRGWALAQIRAEGAPRLGGDTATSEARIAELLAYQALTGRQRKAGEDAEAARRERQRARNALSRASSADFLRRVQLGVAADQGFAERWALFWSNAITVSAVKLQSRALAAQYENDAIRPRVFGRFEDLVLAAEQHPAMLYYLDQSRSIGPNSRSGERRDVGLNENLAREMMELHTVGADAGYSQADVTELARALTGWSTPSRSDLEGARRAAAFTRGRSGFVYRPSYHEPGARAVMGRTYPEGGLAQGEAALRDLARHPATARRLSRRLAAHFVADAPPDALAARLEQAWTRSDGDLGQVARALIEAPEAWTPQPAKIKTPYEFVVSTHRALGTRPTRAATLQQTFREMGQPPFTPPSPEGWPDTVADWAGPDALVKRLNWAKTTADAAEPADTDALAAEALGARLGERTRLAVSRAESRTEALTLLLMSPEFMRR